MDAVCCYVDGIIRMFIFRCMYVLFCVCMKQAMEERGAEMVPDT